MWPLEKKNKESEKIMVRCEECKHYIDEEDAQIIHRTILFQSMNCWRDIEFYCPMHKKPYDEVIDNKFYKTIPTHKVEVQKDGTEILTMTITPEEARQDVERENHEAVMNRERYEEAQFDEDHDPEPSEEDLALKGLDREHVEDYLEIKHAVAHTDLAHRLVDLAVKNGLHDRT